MTKGADLYRVRSLSECLRDPEPGDDATPVLLHVMTQVEYWAKQTLRTMALGNEALPTNPRNRWRSPSLLVIQVSPRPGSREMERIIVGRTARADVCLPYPRISKHHAHFASVDGLYRIVDAGSTNGTYIDGEQIPEHEEVVLRDDCTIHFGKYETRYLSAAKFTEHLAACRRSLAAV